MATKNKKPKKQSSKVETKKRHVPSLKSNLSRTWRTIKTNPKLFARFLGLYAALYFLLVRSITQLDLNDLRSAFSIIYGQGSETFNVKVNVASELFAQSAAFDQASGFYFTILTVIGSLAMIWLLRHVWSGKKTTVKEALYQGMYPLVPFLLILTLMIIQLLPFAFGSYIFNQSFTTGIALSFIEKLTVVAILVITTLLTLYWVSSSVIAAYAVTVPGVYPMAALRRAREILRGRRILVVRQMLGFILLSGMFGMASLVLVLYVVPDTALVFVTLLTLLIMPWLHFYLYGLYRDLINDE